MPITKRQTLCYTTQKKFILFLVYCCLGMSVLTWTWQNYLMHLCSVESQLVALLTTAAWVGPHQGQLGYAMHISLQQGSQTWSVLGAELTASYVSVRN